MIIVIFYEQLSPIWKWRNRYTWSFQYSQGDDSWWETLGNGFGVHAEGTVFSTGAGGWTSRSFGSPKAHRRPKHTEKQHTNRQPPIRPSWGPSGPCFHHLPPSLLQLELSQSRNTDGWMILVSVRPYQENCKRRGCEWETWGGVRLRRDGHRESGQWLVFLGACMRVYLIFSVFSAVSLSLWCSCQSTDCRSVSASAALHTLSLRPECSNADTELLTIAWTNT